MSSRNTKILLAVVVLLAVAGVAVWQLYFNKPQSQIPDITLTLVGADGASKTVTSKDLDALPKTQMKGGLKTSAGSMAGGVKTYTGIALSEIVKLVGGMTNQNSLRVTASDNYAMILTWDELSGKVVTYSLATGDEVTRTKPLIPILAYLEEGKPIATGEGPLRLVYVGEEGLVTDGHFWIKMASKLEVIPGIREWTLTLAGARNEVMNRSTIESGVSCPDTPPQHKASYVDSDGHIWVGMPIWLLIGHVDDQNVHETGAFNRTLADSNAYTVKITSGDGFSVTLNSTFVKQNQNIFVANSMDGKPLADPYWPLRLTGSALKKGQMVRNVVKIELTFNTTKPKNVVEDDAIIASATWTLHLKGKISEPIDAKTLIQYTKASPNGGASWTDTDGHAWFGIPLWSLLGRVDDSQPLSYNSTYADAGYTVTVKAGDGFSKDFASATLKNNNDIILAYKMDGKALPSDQAPLKLVGKTLTKGQMVKSIVEIDLK